MAVTSRSQIWAYRTRTGYLIVAITAGVKEPKDLGHHIMACHRQLAEIDGPDQNAFRRIADQLAEDLNKDSDDESIAAR